MDRDRVISEVAKLTAWWLGQRLSKIGHLRYESMAVNPFLLALIMGIHGHESFEELVGFLLGGHFSIGHATGFGKLIDEKILPQVFGTAKLNRALRRENPDTFGRTEFDDVDHIVTMPDGDYYLSLKAGRWTIQLGQAVGLNASFERLIRLREEGVVDFQKIVISTFYGTEADLTDKYRIVRGITTGADHHVTDISENVEVRAGREFWTWIGGGHPETQEWVLDGILAGISARQSDLEGSRRMLERFKAAFAEKFSEFVGTDGAVDWHRILAHING